MGDRPSNSWGLRFRAVAMDSVLIAVKVWEACFPTSPNNMMVLLKRIVGFLEIKFTATDIPYINFGSDFR